MAREFDIASVETFKSPPLAPVDRSLPIAQEWPTAEAFKNKPMDPEVVRQALKAAWQEYLERGAERWAWEERHPPRMDIQMNY